jgi:hypothetical protein
LTCPVTFVIQYINLQFRGRPFTFLLRLATKFWKLKKILCGLHGLHVTHVNLLYKGFVIPGTSSPGPLSMELGNIYVVTVRVVGDAMAIDKGFPAGNPEISESMVRSNRRQAD